MAFFFVFSSFLAILYGYTGFRLIPTLLPKKMRIFAWLFLAGSLLVLVLHIYLRVNYVLPGLSRISAWIGYTALGFLSYLFILVLMRDLGLLAVQIVSRLRRIVSTPRNPGYFNPRRRQFLLKSSGATAVALSAAATGIGFSTAVQSPHVIRVPIPLKPKDKALSGLTIVQLTDLHVGPIVQYPYVKKVCDTIHQLNADLIVFTGDLADGSPRHLARDVSPMGDLQAPLGKFFVTGNHEYYSGVNRWLLAAAGLGFTPLLNEHRIIPYNRGALSLGGVTDIQAGAFLKSHRSSPRKAFAGCPDDSFKLLLAHQPPSVYEAAHIDVDLQLSGHTHGGQYFPLGWVILLEQPFVKGLYQYRHTRIYVNQGTGYWGPPLRLGTVPEITLITLV